MARSFVRRYEEEETTERANRQPCGEGVCVTSDCASSGKQNYIELVCPDGKTPTVVSSLYGLPSCDYTKGECTVPACVDEYPCRGQSSCYIATEGSESYDD